MTLEETIEILVRQALAEDLGEQGDITSLATITNDAVIVGRITAKSDGVIAGLDVVVSVYQHIDPAVEVAPCVVDGTPVTCGTLVCEVRGPGRSVLSGERVALNFLQHLSGIATMTAQYVQAVAGTSAVILDTRKTIPGWRLLEKYAVRMGGGHNHRMGLYDAVMVKDNHIAAAGGITAAVKRVRSHPAADGLPIIVEVENLEGLREALALQVDQILLDNMPDDMMRAAVNITARRTPLEASGNVNLERVTAIAQTGVDFISVGALTHSAPAFDLSMRLQQE